MTRNREPRRRHGKGSLRLVTGAAQSGTWTHTFRTVVERGLKLCYTFEFLTYFTKTIQSIFPKFCHDIAPNGCQAHAKDRGSR